MADDRMKDDDLQRNMGTKGEGQDFGKQQTPGRNPQDDRSTGAGQQGGQHKEPRNMEDDEEFDGGTAGGRTGGQNRGGQNR